MNEQARQFGQHDPFHRTDRRGPADPSPFAAGTCGGHEAGSCGDVIHPRRKSCLHSASGSSLCRVLEHVAQTFHLGLYEDETSRLCTWHLPESHYLEAWGDARAYDGTASIVQPLIAPLYEGRSAIELLAFLAGEGNRSGLELVKGYWREESRQSTSTSDFESFGSGRCTTA